MCHVNRNYGFTPPYTKSRLRVVISVRYVQLQDSPLAFVSVSSDAFLVVERFHPSVIKEQEDVGDCTVVIYILHTIYRASLSPWGQNYNTKQASFVQMTMSWR